MRKSSRKKDRPIGRTDLLVDEVTHGLNLSVDRRSSENRQAPQISHGHLFSRIQYRKTHTRTDGERHLFSRHSAKKHTHGQTEREGGSRKPLN